MIANLARPTRFALFALVALVGSLTMLPSANAGEGDDFGVTFTPLLDTAQATFSFDTGTDACDSNTVVTVDGGPDVSVVLTDANSGTINFPAGTPGGAYSIIVTCDAGKGGPLQGSGTLFFATVNIDKVVTGDAPADTQFAISVNCVVNPSGASDSFPVPEGTGSFTALQADLTYDAAGGSRYLVAYGAQDCTVSETDDGGATSSSIEVEDCGSTSPTLAAEAAGPSGTFGFPAPTDCTQTVTNNFTAAAQPAAVVQAQPAFTG